MPITLDALQRELAIRDDGVLRRGRHREGREFCALEFEGALRGRPWGDQPLTLPDLRALNDAAWPNDEARTAAILPVMVALWDWAEWAPEERAAWEARVLVGTVQLVAKALSELTGEQRAAGQSLTTREGASQWVWGTEIVRFQSQDGYGTLWALRSAIKPPPSYSPIAYLAATLYALGGVWPPSVGRQALLDGCALWITAAQEIEQARAGR